MALSDGQLELDRMQVERIVEAVMRRLNEQGLAPTKQLSGEVVIQAHVISMDSLSCLEDATSLVIGDKAIVTPAAQDFLRERGVGVRRTANLMPSGMADASQGKANKVVCLVNYACETSLDLGELTAQLVRAGVAAECAPGGLGDDLVGLVEALEATATTCKAICLTSQPSLVLCAANRRPTLRAASANCSCCVRDAADSIGANVLVVQPRGKSQHQLVQLMREFAHCRADCPAQLTPALTATSIQ
ncbi:MAG: hypothetical protein MPJ50_17925 [Pirellulales bacterium]|nr:hypothetical protein [Pirellulales bacterium]